MIVLFVPAGFTQQGHPIPVSPQSAPSPPVAQEPDLSARGRIRVTVNLVLIDARVTDRNGKLIRELKPEQFTVLENDKPQKVSSVEYFDASEYDVSQPTERKPLIVRLTGLKPPENVRQELQKRRLIVLFYDLTSMQPDQLLRAISSGQEYVQDQMSPADLTAVVTFGNQLRVMASFTNNRDALSKAIRAIRPGKDSELADMAV